ncbi:hypothetical protein B0T49_21755 [Chromobacterium violaceum]|uniref:hypothetical protein n=1 Tax=Chromobacterium violaceum TaxID=536 RepID=UPI0009DB6A55|nr:hypothetical protein [Chromobacterium violaceum]OQS44024.1 hypothetical protein B0T48_21885 [Chromobacterium violaceum]OQS45261.1 hypothetical protein B0T49_21755 [Chromobacterium violaceum]
MKKSIEYLIEAKTALNAASDYALAKALKTSHVNISNYMNGKSQMDDYHCIKVAQVLGIDPMEIIAAAQEEREKNEEKREFWRDFREARTRERGHASVQMIGAVAMMMMGALLAMKWPEGIYGLYYVKSCIERIFKQTAKMLVTRYMSLLRNTRQKLTQFSYLASVFAS